MRAGNRGASSPSAPPPCARWNTQPAKGRGEIRASSGEANLFIYPGYKFQVVQALLTNFHLPQSTLLMLVCALGGKENVMRAYEHAVAQRYRFYSYGDCMFVEPPQRG